jgi:hypothetical protein
VTATCEILTRVLTRGLIFDNLFLANAYIHWRLPCENTHGGQGISVLLSPDEFDVELSPRS